MHLKNHPLSPAKKKNISIGHLKHCKKWYSSIIIHFHLQEQLNTFSTRLATDLKMANCFTLLCHRVFFSNGALESFYPKGGLSRDKESYFSLPSQNHTWKDTRRPNKSYNLLHSPQYLKWQEGNKGKTGKKKKKGKTNVLRRRDGISKIKS